MITKEKLEELKKEAEQGIEIYTDYNDVLSDGDFKKIRNLIEDSKETPINVFCDWLTEQYNDWYYDYSEDIKAACDNVGIDYDALDEYDQQAVRDTFLENTFLQVPYEHYLKQKVCINIVIDAGDADYDFGINEVYPHYNGDYDTLEEEGVPEESCLYWLAEQQGYSEKDLRAALLDDEEVTSKFLKSVRWELKNMGSGMPALVFMRSMTVEEWLNLLTTERIHISKKTLTGLVDFWNGGGSVLEIELEKDMDFDKKFAFEIRPDCTYRYGVLDIYGASESLYDAD